MSVLALKLAITDSDGSPLDLMDRTNFLVSRQGPSGAPKFQSSPDGLTIDLPILCYGPTPATNWKKIAQKLYTYAPLGAGPWGVAQENVVLLMKLEGESNFTSYDVVGGMFDPTDLFQVGAKIAAKATLHCLPWARAASTTYGGLVVPTGGGAVWLAAVPGDVPAIARVRVVDTCTNSKNLVRLRIGQHSHPDLAQSDITPFLTPVAASPGATFSDATAYGTTSARLNPCTAAMQKVATANGPATGKFNRRVRVFAKVKSSIAPVGQPKNFAVSASAGAGNIGTETIKACVVPYDGSAPYVSGVNHLGSPSALVSKSTTLLVAGGTQQVALTPLFYDDAELNSLIRWFPGPSTYTNVTNVLGASGSGGSASVTTGASFKETGSYGIQLTAVSPNDAASIHHSSIAILAQTADSTKPRQSSHCRIKIQAETSNTDVNASGLRAYAHWVKWGSAGTANNLAGLATLDGSNWGFYTSASIASPAPDGTALGTGFTLHGATFTLAAGFHDSEITIDVTDSVYISLRLTVDGVPQGGFSTPLPSAIVEAFGCTACATSPVNTTQATETLWVDTFSVEDGYLGTGTSISSYAYIYSWDAAPNATGGYLLKYTTGTSSVWNSIDVGAVTTYTLTTILPNGVAVNSPPPSGLPALVATNVAVKAGLQGSPLPAVSANPAAVQCALGGNRWEWLDCGELDFGPLVPRWQTQAPPCYIELDAQNSSGGTLAVDQFCVIDARLPRQTLTQLSNTAQYTWDSDTRPDNEVGCALVGQALTVSGNEITDVTRAAAVEGDALTIPAGYGIWGASNQGALHDPSFETGVASWSGVVGTETLTSDTAHALFGTKALKVVTPGGAIHEGAYYNQLDADFTGGNTCTVSAWVWAASALNLTLHVITSGVGAIGDTNFTTTPNAWTRVVKSGTVGGAGAGKSVFGQIYTQGTTAATWWVEGYQPEPGGIATPFIVTAGSARAAARVQVSSSNLVTGPSGFVAFRVMMGFPSASGLASNVLWSWVHDANNYYALYYDGPNTRWVFACVQAGVTVNQLRTGFTYVGGELVSVVAYWTGTTINLSVNNGAVGTSAVAGVPGSLPTNMDIGSAPTLGTFPFDGTVLWAMFGTGTPSAADLTLLGATVGSTPPTHFILSSAAGGTGVWAARSAVMDSVGFANSTGITGRANASGPMTVGPGGTWLTVIPEVGDGSGNALADAVNAQCEFDVIVTPRYSISAGS